MMPVKKRAKPAELEIRDYNGTGNWSPAEVLNRYLRYCAELQVAEPLDLSPQEFTNRNMRWACPVMFRVIDGIEQGDAACRRIGIEFIEEDSKFPFGKILKSNTARALRRSRLTETEQERVRGRIVAMLLARNVPHEFKQYAKLLKKLGLGEHWPRIESEIDRSNEYVMRYYRYLKQP